MVEPPPSDAEGLPAAAGGPERLLLVALLVAVVDSLYLSWRFLALAEGWVTPGTGLCSWTAYVDCDCVLRTAEARAFHVPNALLGLGFFLGCAVWWGWCRRRPPAQRRLALQLLAAWLAVATGFTLYFFGLLVQLPCLCPFCPWNHVWTWVALGAALRALRRTPPSAERASLGDLAPQVAVCVGLFAAINGGWLLLRGL